MLTYTKNTQIIRQGYDRKQCWVQTRAGHIPHTGPVITTQKLDLSGSDIFHAIHSLHSTDHGTTWTDPIEQPGLGRLPLADGIVSCPCDGTPAWHAPTRKLLITGHTALYRGTHLAQDAYARRTWYSTYDPTTHTWSPQQYLQLPDPQGQFYNAGAGCTQRVDLPNGDILLPIYYKPHGHQRHHSTVLRCTYDGTTLTYLQHGNQLAHDQGRGVYEPSLATHAGRYYLTLRNDTKGYVAVSDDGLNYTPHKPWTFDDGTEIGNYNTQQHWVAHSDALYLVYTRRGLDNDHVFRHRAPLVMAQVDTDRLCLIRDTETTVVPQRGARLGNFGITTISPTETWIVVSEWMQTTAPDPHDSTQCEKHGSNNAFYITRLNWNKPNQQAPW